MSDLPITKPLDEERCLMVLISAIDLGDRMRDVDEFEAQKLSESIAMRGLDNAITLREIAGETDRFKLVSGGHRIRAHQMLGLAYIRADLRQMPDDEALSVERDENFFRYGLTAAQTVIAAGSFFDEWEALNGPIKAGRPKGSEETPQTLRNSNPFDDLSEKTGKSKRTIEDLASIYRKVGRDNLTALQNSGIADNASQLKALAKLPPEDRPTIIARLVDGSADTVKAAVQFNPDMPPRTEVPKSEQFLSKIRKVWATGSKRAQDQFLEEIGAVRK